MPCTVRGINKNTNKISFASSSLLSHSLHLNGWHTRVSQAYSFQQSEWAVFSEIAFLVVV